MKRILRSSAFVFAALAVLATVAVGVSSQLYPTINRVETGVTPEYPALRPRTFQLGYDRVFDEASSAISDLEGWKVDSVNREAGTLNASMEMPITGWQHKISIQVTKKTRYTTKVGLVSENPENAGDLGQNARNVDAYLTALSERLGAAEVGGEPAPSDPEVQ